MTDTTSNITLNNSIDFIPSDNTTPTDIPIDTPIDAPIDTPTPTFEELSILYYGSPPYYRNIENNLIEPLPFRIRMPDRSTRTDPSQWKNDPLAMEASGFVLTTITQLDLSLKMT
jgi:hypothetical protein